MIETKEKTQLFQQLAIQEKGHTFATAPNIVRLKATTCGPADKKLNSKKLIITSVPKKFRATIIIQHAIFN